MKESSPNNRSSPSYLEDKFEQRPYVFTPHPRASSKFDYDSTLEIHDDIQDDNVETTDYQSSTGGGCLGLSLLDAMNNRIERLGLVFRNALSCNCTKDIEESERVLSFDDSYFFSFDGEKSLLGRAASYATNETEPIGKSTSNDTTSIQPHSHVQFHYPPITSVRQVPRLRSDEIEQLFFAPEELDEIEDDRSDTKAADDIEALAVGDEWNSLDNDDDDDSDCDEQDNSAISMRAENGELQEDGPPTTKKRRKKRFVRGVQIMLREKSTT